MDTILSLDQELFLLLNHLPHNALTNALALTLSGVGTAGFIWFMLGIVLVLKEEKRDHWFFLPLLSAGGGSWLAVELLLKNLIARARPTLEMGAIIVGSDTNGFSFPSGHATVAFAMAMVLSHKEPRWRRLLYLLAVAIAVSRIFLGKHYPLDVAVGALLGWGVGNCALWLTDRIKKYVSSQTS